MDIKYNKGDTGYLRRTDGRKVFDVSHVRTLLTALRDFHTPGTLPTLETHSPPVGAPHRSVIHTQLSNSSILQPTVDFNLPPLICVPERHISKGNIESL